MPRTAAGLMPDRFLERWEMSVLLNAHWTAEMKKAPPIVTKTEEGRVRKTMEWDWDRR